MQISVNVAFIRPGRVGGSEQYTMRLLRAVHDARPADLEVEVWGSAEIVAAHPFLAELGHHPLGQRFRWRPHRLVAESTRLYAATSDADVVHHFGGRLPARRHGCDVVTIHDLQPLEAPRNFSLVKAAYLRMALPRSAHSARLICTPSAWAAGRIVERLAVPEDRVRIVSSTWEVHAGGTPDEALIGELGEGPVVLFPAVTHPHKNHAVLLEALDRIEQRHRDLTLVLTGGRGRAEQAVAAAIQATSHRVMRPGWVSEATLGALLSRADVVAFPSRYEGFGLPVIEAMRAGTPVVAAAATALPELVGDAGLLVDPDDVDGWADAIDGVLTDAALRRRLAAAGTTRADRHRPEAAAARLIDVWREMA